MNRIVHTLLFAIAALVATGCTDVTNVIVATDAPPGRVAEVDPEDETIRLSTGVAVAVECFFMPAFSEDYVPYPGYACDDLEIEAFADDDGEPLLDIVPAHLEDSAWSTGYYSYEDATAAQYSQTNQTGSDRAVFVLVGKRAGTGELVLRHEDAELTFLVEVFPGAGALEPEGD
jgi:hypothetical protein